MVPCYSYPSKLIQVPPFEIQAPLWATMEPPASQGSQAYRNAEGAMLTCCERTKSLCGHLCSMANGGTLATAERKSPPDNDRNRHSHNSSMLAKQVFTQVDTDSRVLTQSPLLVLTCLRSGQDAISSL